MLSSSSCINHLAKSPSLNHIHLSRFFHLNFHSLLRWSSVVFLYQVLASFTTFKVQSTDSTRVGLEELISIHSKMNGKKGSIEINMPPISKAKVSETTKKNDDKFSSISCKSFILRVWEFCKEDSNRVIFSLKVGLAVLLVSLLILCQTPYRVFGTNIIWSILTVAIMFEYTVGMCMQTTIHTHTITYN